MGDINVTPMIDILLVLLIIFMVIVPVTPKGLDALVPQPPKDPQKQPPPNDRTIVVQVIYQRRRMRRPTRSTRRCRQGEICFRKLTDIYSNRAERVMFVKGDDDLNFRLRGRGHRHRPGGQRRSHRPDDAEDHGWPVAVQHVRGVMGQPARALSNADCKAYNAR